MSGHAARDISFASSAETFAGKCIVRAIENLTGRMKLIQMAAGYEHEVRKGKDIWQVLVDRYKLELKLLDGSFANIPSEGPVIVTSNHPFGILDGLILGHILQKARGDFRILANSVYNKAEDLDQVILPIEFAATSQARKVNVATRKQTLKHLGNGGCVGIFPSGTVSTPLKPFGRPMDPEWRRFTAKLIAQTNAVVVPIYFEGHNSRLFQVLSHIHTTLRISVFIREFARRIDSEVPVVLGQPICQDLLQKHAKDPAELMRFLRTQTYQLSPSYGGDDSLGLEVPTAT